MSEQQVLLICIGVFLFGCMIGARLFSTDNRPQVERPPNFELIGMAVRFEDDRMIVIKKTEPEVIMATIMGRFVVIKPDERRDE